MRPTRMRLGLVVFLFWLFGTCVAPAQTGRMFCTVEAMVGAAEGVYAGKVVGLNKLELKGPLEPGARPGYEATIKVDETVKGPPHAALTLRFTSYLPESFLRDSVSKGHSFLVMVGIQDEAVERFLKKELGGSASPDSPVRWGWYRLHNREEVRYGDWDERIFKMDFGVCRNWDELLGAARSFGRKHAGAVESEGYTIPHAVARICGDPNAYAHLLFPKSPQREKTAHFLISTPERLMARGVPSSPLQPLTAEEIERGEDVLRLIGLDLLRDFKSASNIRLLKRQVAGTSSKTTAEYRARARRILEGWGVKSS